MTTTPRAAGFRMPPEWARHERTWMEFPPDNDTFAGTDLDRYRATWASVANTIGRFEPVSVLCARGDVAAARRLLEPAVELHEVALDDAWLRDSGPTFVVHPDGRLGAVHWRFNGWGDQGFSDWGAEQHVGARVAELAGAELFVSGMVNEGGGIHVDGEGTVLVTETVQLDPGRNPGWTAAQVESELAECIGVERVIWLPRGLTRDYDRFGTRGHVDIVATFVRPGVVLAQRQVDPAHPDHEVCHENISVLRAATDARGRRLEVVEIDSPRTGSVDGELVDWSYINHYVCNGAVIMCTFDDPNDEPAAELLSRLYPGRRIVPHDARAVFECGGGIHCITQQQPAV